MNEQIYAYTLICIHILYIHTHLITAALQFGEQTVIRVYSSFFLVFTLPFNLADSLNNI